MKSACFLVVAFATALVGVGQQKSLTGDFTRSPTEHIINQIDQPFVVRSIRGTIIEEGGPREPLPTVLFEIQGTDADKRIRRGTTDQHGRFKIAHVPAGTYGFKATLNGFQSVMGTITVSNKADKTNDIRIEMRIGV